MNKSYPLLGVLYALILYLYGYTVNGQSPDSLQLNPHQLSIKEETYWKGPITVKPHGLYFGSGLARDGSFFLGDSSSLKRVDFKTGKIQTLIEAPAQEGAIASVISPDNQQVAYYWFNGKYNDLRVVSFKDGHPSQPRVLLKGEGQYPKPLDWSPDGKYLLVRLVGKDGEKLALVSVQDGAIKVVKEVGQSIINKSSFSPDGQYIVYDYGNHVGASDIRVCRIDGTSEEVLVKEAGYGPYWSPDGQYIFYLTKKDKQLCNLWALPMSKTKATGNAILLKERIDFFSPLGFIRNGSFLFGEQSSIKLNVYSVELDPATVKEQRTPEILSTRFPDRNTDAVWSSNGKYLAYLSKRETGTGVLVIRSTDTGKEEDILGVSGSIVQWFPDNTSLFLKTYWEKGTVKLYRFNVNTKDITLLYELQSDREKNLHRDNPFLSADGKLIYFIEQNNNAASSKIFSVDNKTGTVKKVTSLDSSTITSYSASHDGKYLSFIILYNQQEGRPSAIKIVSLQTSEIREVFKAPWGDATKFYGLSWSPDSRYVYYVRPNYQTAALNIWRIPTAGGVPQNTGIAMTDIRMPKVHPDGKRLVFWGGEGAFKRTYEVKAIKVTPGLAAQAIQGRK